MRAFTAILGVSIVALPGILAAQVPPNSETGVRIRVTAPDCGIHRQTIAVGTFRGDTLVVGATECPLDLVTHLDAYRGKESNVGTWALIWATGGAVDGVYAVVRVGREQGGEGISNGGAAALLAGAAVAGAVVGGALGAGIGALIKTDRWEEVPLDRLRVSFAPRRDGFAVGLSVSF